MSTDIGEKCAYGMGPARSSAPHAYRCESYGLLSLLCFLKRLAEFTGYHEPWHGIVATDSQSLIDTVLDKLRSAASVEASMLDDDLTVTSRNVKIAPMDPMSLEWDIIRGIQVLLLSMPAITLQHVRGHQDKHTPYLRLPLLAQLNVDADTQATRFQQQYGCF